MAIYPPKKAKSKKDKARMTAAAEGIARNRRSIQKAAKAPKPKPAARRGQALKMNSEAMDAFGF